ncbi:MULTISPECIES: YscO family type III secretion system apparatus protein [Pseudomonas]|jgi:LmbE family N-acetylglucosaminyl deacetylase|uniref:type III secretion system stalk subunit SctO n=1 Tax=Pseudomonas TaxID=286 RepID=UPI000D0D4D9A|nr:MULTISPECIES: YscO family type III secretion system apparatus protein [Pseudomonas]MBK3508710.1 YscO family type III secretion system apparatus protein [Pseudomonas sp. MF6747]MBT0625689.1 YscO family type III secretion system apparatus protein [Pseudomonas fluorescens]PSL92654.1 type III secretion protein [Pseudomonas sp. R9.37]QJI15372.1 YscO family type III secretion system apparatus protein [Pseudomonas sp. ADAK22]TVT88267.1 type III secretion protein [Pseudomonas sp. RGB]
MFLSELETLRRLRKHRADRAERALGEAKRHQRALQLHVEQAQQRLEDTRLQEAEEAAQLLSKHQGHVLSFQELKSWNTQERSLSASTQREEAQLQALQGQQEQQVVHIDSMQKQASQYLREVEKLSELSQLLVQERHETIACEQV